MRAVHGSPDQRFVISGSADCTSRVWSIASGACLRLLRGFDLGVRAVAISWDGCAAGCEVRAAALVRRAATMCPWCCVVLRDVEQCVRLCHSGDSEVQQEWR